MEDRTLFDYWMVLYRRKGILLLVLAAAVATAYLLSTSLAAVYEARVVFYVPAQSYRTAIFQADAPRTIAPTLLGPAPVEDAHAAHIGMLKSKEMARRILERFPDKTPLDLERNVDFQLSNEFMLQVYVRDRDPRVAADIANAYYAQFSRLLEGIARGPALLSEQVLGGQLAEARRQLAQARAALEAFEAGKGIADLSTETLELLRRQSSFQTSLETSQIALRELDSKIAGTRREFLHETALYIPTEKITTDPIVEQLRKEIVDIEAAIGAKSTELRDRHPDLLALRAQAETKKRELARAIDSLVKSYTKTPESFHESLRRSLATLLVDKEVTGARLIALQRTIADIDARLAKLPEVKARHAELSREVAVKERLVENLTNDLEGGKIQSVRGVLATVLVDPATPPQDPAFPILWVNLIVAIGLGLIAGIFYCFLLDYIQRTRRLRRVRESVAGRIALESL